MQKFSYLKSANAEYIDELFQRYRRDPDSIDASWRYFFEGLELGGTLAPTALPNGHAKPAGVPAGAMDLGAEAKVAELIAAYRENGKWLAHIDPLTPAPSSHPQLSLANFGLTEADLGKSFAAGRLIGLGTAKLSEILAALRETYCRTIAVEFTHISNREERLWLQTRMEQSRNREALDAETRKFILERLTAAETFERFLHTRYVAQKRFSVEGGESVIPALDVMIEAAAELGAREFVLGMAHRGRLNVLTHTLGKKLEHTLTSFEGAYKIDLSHGEGDVKYHMGYSQDSKTRKGKDVHLSLAFNPSHLEFVNPVVEGMVRAKQRQRADAERTQVIPILIHGDAAFAGQGVCYETLNLSQLEGFATGGTLHVVINNQIGFTVEPKDARSTSYSTDMAKMLETPIFHVNGDDPEAVWHVSKLATEYRQKFRKDVFIDLVCYRKHGHNEGDEPSFTQPLMYKKIKAHASTRELYARELAAAGVISETEGQAMVEAYTEKMASAQAKTKAENPTPHVSVFEGKAWSKLQWPTQADLFKPVQTAVSEKTLKALGEKLNTLPGGFKIHPKLARFFETRLRAIQDGKGLDWGNGEALAFATLVAEGHDVRITGQDAERGTFTHRHSVLNDFETGQTWTPLNHLSSTQGRYTVHNSHLSETGVMGFEFGYSLAEPNALVIWEAQFGDFANGAQVIIDQFLAAGESKWQRMSGLVLLLPHGYEGQGPEHSSARVERFLQLCGRGNLIVANFTTPAQLFHGLRRQLKRSFRKPLVVMTPKSLLRHPLAISPLEEFTKGSFQEVLDDSEADPAQVKRVLLCSGKVYYDLLTSRREQKRQDIAIVRVEQLYPWPEARLAEVLGRYKNAKDLVWVQEEPRNMGPWQYVFGTWSGALDEFSQKVGGRAIRYVGREIAASPAVGYAKVHEQEQQSLLEKAFSK